MLAAAELLAAYTALSVWVRVVQIRLAELYVGVKVIWLVPKPWLMEYPSGDE
jgi:hypothetical protein